MAKVRSKYVEGSETALFVFDPGLTHDLISHWGEPWHSLGRIAYSCARCNVLLEHAKAVFSMGSWSYQCAGHLRFFFSFIYIKAAASVHLLAEANNAPRCTLRCPCASQTCIQRRVFGTSRIEYVFHGAGNCWGKTSTRKTLEKTLRTLWQRCAGGIWLGLYGFVRIF